MIMSGICAISPLLSKHFQQSVQRNSACFYRNLSYITSIGKALLAVCATRFIGICPTISNC